MTQTLSSLGADAPDASGLNETQLLDVYRTMRTIRDFEERVHDEFATGDIPGFVHLYAGEEASATGVCAAPRPTATRSPARTAATATASPRASTSTAMMAEIYGKATGSCQRQGRLDAHRRPVEGHARRERHRRRRPAADLRRARWRRSSRATAVSASRSSATAPPTRARRSSALNLASVWNLPAIFVAENNGYAEATASTWSVAADNIADRAQASACPA